LELAQDTALPQTTSLNMERSNSSSLSPLEFQNLLNVYRLCFEAAIKAHRAPSVTAFSQHTKYHDVWRVYEDKRTHGKIPLGAHKILVNAYNKWNLCDHFCAMIFDALRKHLERTHIQAQFESLQLF
jgi:hypothetical protein